MCNWTGNCVCVCLCVSVGRPSSFPLITNCVHLAIVRVYCPTRTNDGSKHATMAFIGVSFRAIITPLIIFDIESLIIWNTLFNRAFIVIVCNVQ